MGVGVSPQSLDSSTARGTNAVTILIIGLISIIAIALIAFVAINVLSSDSSETSNIDLPTAQFIGMDINGTPGKVNYLILRVSNPSSREAFTISGQDLTMVYQDELNQPLKVLYPAMDTGLGLIADARDTESIDACSELADQPNNIAIWCFVNDGFSPSISPGMSGDIYVFLGGLSIPLRENMEFSIDLISGSRLDPIIITAKGTTPRVFKLPAATDTPTPTPEPTATPTTPQLVVIPVEVPISPTVPALQPPPALPAILPTPTATAPTPTATVPTPTATAPTPPATAPAPSTQPVALPAVASNVIPHAFVGSVTVSGEVAPDGTEVSAWVSEYSSPVGEGTVSGGSYVMNVSQYGSASFEGKTLTFKIGGVDTIQTSTWATGGATVLDLS